jgi:hypothetical protein
MMIFRWFALYCAVLAAAYSQVSLSLVSQSSISLSGLDKLGAKAVETVDVTLDRDLLQLGAKFLSRQDTDQAKVKKLVAGLKSITVKSFEFEKEGEYSPADVDSIRAQLRSPQWSRIIGVRNSRERENSEVFVKRETGEMLGGLVVINMEPKELTVVHIDGPIDLNEIGELGGHFGIPPIRTPKPAAP